MTKFKIGDKVRVTKCLHGHGFNINEIVEIIHHNISIEDYECENSTDSWFLRDTEFELYKEKETEMALTNEMTAEQIRNEILRIDSRIEEANKDIEKAQEERSSLVEKLREKGFELSGKIQATDGGYNVCTVDNVKEGDLLILTEESWNNDIPTGIQVRVIKNDFSDVPLKIKTLDGLYEDWTKINTVKFK